MNRSTVLKIASFLVISCDSAPLNSRVSAFTLDSGNNNNNVLNKKIRLSSSMLASSMRTQQRDDTCLYSRTPLHRYPSHFQEDLYDNGNTHSFDASYANQMSEPSTSNPEVFKIHQSQTTSPHQRSSGKRKRIMKKPRMTKVKPLTTGVSRIASRLCSAVSSTLDSVAVAPTTKNIDPLIDGNNQLLITKPSSHTISKNKRKREQLLTKEDEATLTYAIRSLSRAIQIRDDLTDELNSNNNGHDGSLPRIEPTEHEWADACGLSTLSLRRVMIAGKEARSELVEKNTGLVVQIAKRYYNQKNTSKATSSILTLQDMIQEGNIGLMEAAERFDPSKGFKFSTYAAWWVRQRILRAITDHSRIIRLPVHVYTLLNIVEKKKKEMTEEIGRVPSIPELAHELEIPLDKLNKYIKSSRSVLSLEGPKNLGKLDDDRVLGDGIASDTPSPEDNAHANLLREHIREVVDILPSKERNVLVHRFGLNDGSPKTVKETAELLGISRERVRNVEARAINKLRRPGINYKLKDYVGDLREQYTISEEVGNTPEEIWSF